MRSATIAMFVVLGASAGPIPSAQAQRAEASESMSFFVASRGQGDGANLGGLEGADRHCQILAHAAGAGTRTWRAYLSMTGIVDREVADARRRIGYGPWYNARGEQIARDVDELHGDNGIDRQTALTEEGEAVASGEHDILTGSREDGTAYLDGADHTCRNWTSNDEGSAQVGHHDRRGEDPSWNSAHASSGCGQQDLGDTGGSGLFYCFAIN